MIFDADRHIASAQNCEVGLLAHEISVTYPNGHKALESVSFSIPKGSICALVGVNGSGKSSLFKAIMGFVKLQAQDQQPKIEIMGLNRRQALKENLVAYVPQAEEIDWDFPILVKDVVMMGRYGHMSILRRPRQIDEEKVELALQRVNLWDERDRQIGQLSGGQKKRVFLARALAQEAQVILLDEPFTGVDVTTEKQIVSLMQALRNEGKVLLVSTHNLGSVPDFCDHSILINRTLLAFGRTADVFTASNLEKAFGGALRRFVLKGQALHDDDDRRAVTVLTDDERPFVIYGEEEREKKA